MKIETTAQARRRLLEGASRAHLAGQWEQAAALYRRVLFIDPNHFIATNLLGVICARRGDMQQALALFKKAVAIDERSADAWNNLGNAYNFLLHTQDALDAYRKAVALDRRHSEALSNLGTVLTLTNNYRDAEAILTAALKLTPNSVDLLLRLANCHLQLDNSGLAYEAFERAMALEPDNLAAISGCFWLDARSCRWQRREALAKSILDVSRRTKTYASPFTYLHIVDEPQIHLEAARYACKAPSIGTPYPSKPKPPSDRIRIGYLSTDFRAHPISYLLPELIELHSRDHFEVLGLSAGPDDNSPFRHRLQSSFDRFIDLASLGTHDLARAIHSEDLDILIELNGHTKSTRLQTLSLRLAPIQVSWLGYPGTSGAPFIDYTIVDRYLVPPSHEHYFTESLAVLPDTFQPNDRKRPTSDRPLTRQQYGLPGSGFVLCSFNRWEKITLEVMTTWMTILQRTSNTVLWLREGTPEMVESITCLAKQTGLDPQRLVFSANESYADYLARYRLADLALDPWPFNGGTTSSDALWMGVPILTTAGRSMTARMTGSFLTTLGLADLIATNLDSYCANAIAIAGSPDRLAEIKSRLACSVAESPFFNTPRFCRSIEAAYQKMRTIQISGDKPRNFQV